MTGQQRAPQFLMVVDLSVEQQNMFIIHKGLVTIGGQVEQAQPVVDETNMLIPKVACMIGAAMNDGLRKALQEPVIYMLRIGNACKTTHGIGII
jgi:uncharacterized protein YegL